MRSYLKKLESNDNLSLLINKMLSKVDTLYLLISPNQLSLKEFRKKLNDKNVEEIDLLNNNAISYYYYSVINKNLLNLHRNVIESIECIDEYLDKYCGDYIYFATQKRIEFIEEYGGEDHDYDKDGNVKYLKNEQVIKEHNFLNTINYYIVNKNNHDEFNEFSTKNSIGETSFEDYGFLFTSLENSFDDSFERFFRNQGINIAKFVVENDEIKELSFAEEVESKIKYQLNTENIMATFVQVIQLLNDVSELYSTLKYNENNKKELLKIREILNNILNLKFE